MLESWRLKRGSRPLYALKSICFFVLNKSPLLVLKEKRFHYWLILSGGAKQTEDWLLVFMGCAGGTFVWLPRASKGDQSHWLIAQNGGTGPEDSTSKNGWLDFLPSFEVGSGKVQGRLLHLGFPNLGGSQPSPDLLA